jgi:serine/threonine-protein kinase
MSDETDVRGEPTQAAARPPIGDLVGRQLLHFKIVDRLGAGGMGVVYRAFDSKLRRDVAIKALSARYLADDRNKELIFREARSAAAVSHPNIAAIYEVHDLEEAAFLVMELVDGETLRARLARGALARDEAMRIAKEISRGLARAHAHGVVHRDLKPDNVMLAHDGHVKLLDFGLAKAVFEAEPVAEGAANATGSTIPAATRGRVMGTPGYMSPEQARGEPVDARTDVYAFGAVLYELLSGGSPFGHRSTTPEEWTGEAWQPRPPFRGPRGIAAIVSRCLAVDPEERYRNGTELVAALEVRRRRRWPWLALPIVAMAAGVAVIAVTLPSRDAPTRGDAAVAVVLPPPAASPDAAAPARDPALDIARARVAAAVASFVKWSATHADAPCPRPSELAAELDPWGRSLVVTCVDQPVDQIVGIVSLGPDGVLGTRDDIASWQLGAETRALVQGPHWQPKPKPHAPARPATRDPVRVPLDASVAPPPTPPNDVIPSHR